MSNICVYPERIPGLSGWCYFSIMKTVNVFSKYHKSTDYSAGSRAKIYDDMAFMAATKGIYIREARNWVPSDIMDRIAESANCLMGPFAKYKEENFPFFYDPTFKYCPECLAKGKHFVYNQLKFVDSCSQHKRKLVNKCPNCGEIMTGLFSNPVELPFACPNCGEPLVDFVHPERLLGVIHEEALKDSVVLPAPKYDDALSAIFIATDKDYTDIPVDVVKEYCFDGKLPKEFITVPKNGHTGLGEDIKDASGIIRIIINLTGDDIEFNIRSNKSYYDVYEKVESNKETNSYRQAAFIIMAECSKISHKRLYKDRNDNMYDRISQASKCVEALPSGSREIVLYEVLAHYLERNIHSLRQCITEDKTIADDWPLYYSDNIPIKDFQYIIIEYRNEYHIFPYEI